MKKQEGPLGQCLRLPTGSVPCPGAPLSYTGDATQEVEGFLPLTSSRSTQQIPQGTHQPPVASLPAGSELVSRGGRSQDFPLPRKAALSGAVQGFVVPVTTTKLSHKAYMSACCVCGGELPLPRSFHSAILTDSCFVIPEPF